MPFRPIRACGLSSLLLRTKGATPVSPVAFGAVQAGWLVVQSFFFENDFRKSISATGVLPAACRPAAARASRVCLAGWLADLSLCVRTSTDVCRLSVTRPRIDM